MENPTLEQLLDQIRELVASEYHRGEQDAIARIMKAAQGAPSQPQTHDTLNQSNGHGDALPPRKRERKRLQKERAPEGTAQALIDRVLRARSARGASPAEIQSEALTDAEKLASYSGIRFTLNKGREEGRYRNKDGRWFLKTQSAS